MTAVHSSHPCPTCGVAVGDGEPCLACALELALLEPTPTPAPAPPARGFADFAALELPATLGGYVLRRELGAGGMGTVYEAGQARPQRTVALKMLRVPWLSSPQDLIRFRTEAEAVARLDHPHIVPIYEVGEHRGQPFFTMKLMTGGSLADRLEQGPLPAPAACSLVAKLARAVHHAHQRGVLHRDLKPGNVLFDAAGEPYLTDFGLAKLADAPAAVTLTQAMLGTPEYMSPEQAAGRASQVTTASDVWALGVIFYQLLTGQLPFHADNTPQILRRIAEEEPPPPSTVRPAVHRDLETLCLCCLEKDPARRLPSAAELADELDRWQAGQPIRARPVTPPERLLRWARRYPKTAALTALTLLLAGAGSVGVTLAWRHAVRARQAAEADNYFATLHHALAQRERGDFGAAAQLLAGLPPERRGFEWRLLRGLCRGDETWSATFGGARPAAFALNPATGRLRVLTEDRRFHEVELDTGHVAPAGSVPGLASTVAREAHTGGFRQLAFAPDGRHYLVIEDAVLRVFATDTGAPGFRAAESVSLAAWLDSGRILGSADPRFAVPSSAPGRMADSAWLYDLATGAGAALPPRGYLGPFALSPDGQRLALVRENSAVEVWRLTDAFHGRAEAELPATSNLNILQLAFSGDGARLLLVRSARGNGVVQVVDWATRRMLWEQSLPPLPTVAWSASEPVLAIATREPWLTVWRHLEPPGRPEFDDADLRANEPQNPNEPTIPPRRFLTRSAQQGRLNYLFGHAAPPESLLALPGAAGFVTASGDGTVRRWPPASPVPETQRCAGVATRQAAFHPAASPDGLRVLHRDTAGRARLWQRRDGALPVFPPGQNGLAALDDGRVLTRVNATGEVLCWQTGGGDPVLLWRAPGGPSVQGFHWICHSVVSRDQRRVAALLPGKLLVVDLDTRSTRETPDQAMQTGGFEGQTVDLSPDGRTLAMTGFVGRPARLYAADDLGAPPRRLEAATAPDVQATVCAFSRDGARVFVGYADGWVRVFAAATRQELPAEGWRAHTTEVSALAVSQTGDLLATAAQGSLTLWATALPPEGHRRERLRIPQHRPRNWLQFAGGDTVLLQIAPGEPLQAWEAPH